MSTKIQGKKTKPSNRSLANYRRFAEAPERIDGPLYRLSHVRRGVGFNYLSMESVDAVEIHVGMPLGVHRISLVLESSAAAELHQCLSALLEGGPV